MEAPLVSVIVPVYNVQRELPRCLASILGQTYQNIEIILVDDGSTDNSLKICQQLAATDERICLYSKDNGGLSDARNFGLQHASGDYVAFVDSDDYVEVNYLEELYGALATTKAEVAVCTFKKVDVAGNLIKIVNFPTALQASEISGCELLKLVFKKNGYAFVVAWNKLYKRTLFDKLKFEKGKIYEDEYINFPLFWNVKRVVTVDKPLYNYVQRAGSITNSAYSQAKFESLFELHQRRIAFYQQQQATAHYQLAQQAFRNWCVTFVVQYLQQISPSDLKKMQIAFRRSFWQAPPRQGLHYLTQDISGVIHIRVAAKIKAAVYHR